MKPFHSWALAILVIAGVSILIWIGAPASGLPTIAQQARGGLGGAVHLESEPAALEWGIAHGREETAAESTEPYDEPGGEILGGAESRESEESHAAGLRRLDEIVASLRALAPDDNFHRLAWSLLEEAGAIAKKNDAALARLDELAASLREPPRTRGALLFAACLATSSDKRAAHGERAAHDERAIRCLERYVRDGGVVADALAPVDGLPPAASLPATSARSSDVPAEMARVAWLARAFEGSVRARRPIPLGRFRSRTEMKTYPLSLDRCASPELVAEAIEFAERPIDASRGEIPHDDVFAREVAILGIVATSAESAGPARTRLWHWLEAPTPTALVLGDAAAFALAAAARDDAGLASALLDYAARRRGGPGIDPRPSAVRCYLARFGVLSAELASHLGDVLRGDGSPVSVFERTYAIAALGELLRSDNEEASFAAAKVALERVLDPNHRRIERVQVMDWLAIARHELLLHTATTLLDFERDPKIVANALHDLALVRDVDRPKVVQELPRRFDAQAPDEVRAALVSTLGEVGDPSILGFLVGIARTDSSPAIRLMAERAVAEIERRSAR